jgi:hypothetical protein
LPVVSRARLRQQLGLIKLRDTYVGITTSSWGADASVTIIDSAQANLAFSGEGLYARTWLKVNSMELWVASFNAGSGAYVTLQTAATTVPVGVEYEHHRKMSPAQKDREIDGIIGHLWTRQEIPLNTTDGLLAYSIGQGFKVFGVRYYANPSGTLDRQPQDIAIGWNLVTTGSGREIRLPNGAALAASQQIIIDAQVRATLGAADAATVNIPNEDWVLNGVAARCYQAMVADAPGQEAGKYKELALAYASTFRRDIARFRDAMSSDWRGAFSEVVS